VILVELLTDEETEPAVLSDRGGDVMTPSVVAALLLFSMISPA
jgi:hypothetical protein